MGILKGKLVKKDDKKTIKDLDIQAYPWLSFKEKDIVFPDNPRRSVILQKYHDPKEMRDKVKDATIFSQSLEKKTTPLYPIDLTDDYERGIRERIKRQRRRMMGEEEAMALELAEISQDTKFRVPRPGGYQTKVPIRKTSHHEEIVENKPVFNEEEPVITELENPIIKSVIPEGVVTPIVTQVVTPPVIPVEEVIQEKSIIEAKNDKEMQEKGYEVGYLDGFKNGEERAIKSQESKYETVFQNIAHVVDQIEKLKDSLYAESKDVFIEIIKLCSEKVLREQIKFSDNSLFSLFDEVIKSISQKASMKIELNAQDLARLKNHIEKLGIQDRVTLKEDKDKLSGDFTVESERGISIVSLQKTVENLVDKLKTELFSEEESKKVS